jgi:hypothetical protein
MDDTIKSRPEQLYAKYNFAGIIDWAVDLQAYTADEVVGEDVHCTTLKWKRRSIRVARRPAHHSIVGPA